MSNPSSNGWSRGDVIGALSLGVAVVGVLVLFVPAAATSSTGSNATQTAPAVAAPLASPPPPTATPQHPNRPASPSQVFEPVSTAIASFEVVPGRQDRLVGKDKFLAYDGSSIQMVFSWDVKASDGSDVSECNIRNNLTSLDNNDVRQTLSAGKCPSRSLTVSSKTFLKPGNYKLESTAYVASSNQTVRTDYLFSIVAS